MPDFPRPTTETQLREWRTGQPGAERLAAAILHLDGFEDVDPQAPLGGQDDRKDILCRKGETSYVAAAYFPLSEKSFAQIRNKFKHDLEGAVRRGQAGFIFVTNQHIALTDRATLEELAASQGKLCILFHRERIRGLLDSPAGYGVRLQFLSIPMNESEQLAYFASSGNKLEYAMERHTREIRNLARRIDYVRAGQDFAAQTIYQIATKLGEEVPLPPADAESRPADQLQAEPQIAPMSASLSPSFLLAIHRLVCADMPFKLVGKFRHTTVWIGAPRSSPEEAEHVPPAPDEALRRLDDLLARWNENYPDLATTSEDAKLEALAQFHHGLLTLHPFMDGNGRVARAVLIQQCIDLLGHVDPALLDKGSDYYAALEQADSGDLGPLKILIHRAITQ